MTQAYIRARFGEASAAYTYENATGEILAVGDLVIAETRSGEAKVIVCDVDDIQPIRKDGEVIAHKKILRRAPVVDVAL